MRIIWLIYVQFLPGSFSDMSSVNIFVHKKSEQDFVPVHLYDATIACRYYPEWYFLFYSSFAIAQLEVYKFISLVYLRFVSELLSEISIAE